MRRVLATDAAAPILLEPHILALDRRLVIILKTIHKCLMKNQLSSRVVIDDGF